MTEDGHLELELRGSVESGEARVMLCTKTGDIIRSTEFTPVASLDDAIDLMLTWCEVEGRTSFEINDCRQGRQLGSMVVRL